MKEVVNKILEDLERTENCKVLYACESGSRCWEMESTNSDYDVRFIYVRPRSHYLRVDFPYLRDVLERPITDVDDLDVTGWDLFKALGLLYKSNPPLSEWITSDIVYKSNDDFLQEFRALSKDYFTPVKATQHYLHMAQHNYRQYLQRPEVEVKKYFYVLRPILACCYIERTGKMAPVSLPQLIESEMADGRIKDRCLELLDEKRRGLELGVTEPVQVIDDFLNCKLNHFAKATKDYAKVVSFDKINTFFMEALNRWAP